MPITRKKSTRRKSSSRRKPEEEWFDTRDTRGGTRSGRSSRGRSQAPAYYEPVKRKKRKTTKKKYPAYRFSLLDSISPERRVDLLGIFLAIIGLLTILSLFSANRSAVSGSWVDLLGRVFGWGMYILPVGLLILGAWLVARNVERLPALTLERVIGILLLYTGLLAGLHTFSGTMESAMARAAEGSGGGYLGAFFQQGLVKALGRVGAAIVILGWLMIGTAMTLDLTMAEMFGWVGRLVKKTGERFKETRKKAGETDGFTPLSVKHGAGPQTAPGSGTAGTSGAGTDGTVAVLPTNPPGVSVKIGLPAAMPQAWMLPKVADILEKPQATEVNEEFITKRARLIEETLASFGAPGQVVEISRGPAVTMFGVEPQFVDSRGGPMRVRVGKIAALSDDLALALAAPRIRIQAPVPGRGYVGIEVPNEEMSLVALREVMESEAFGRGRMPLRFALGKDVAGHPKAANLEVMPHLLIAGTTGSGKSVCVNGILTCFLMNNTPDELRLILVDPKRVELTGYNGVPHLLAPVVVEIERVIGALQWMTREMDNRYHKFAEMGARNIVDYNGRMGAQGGKKLPYLVVVIDELADLMMISPEETERTITRLAQLARATGIHMILATQRPSVDVVTGLIKANFPARIAFAVASNTDSRVILDQPGAERLLGRGDMLFQAPDAPAPVRYQGVFVSDAEINRLVDFWRTQAGAASPYAAAGMPGLPTASLPAGVPLKQVPMFEEDITAPQGDPLMGEAIDTCRREGKGSVSMLQRKLRVGYTRAARLVDVLEEKGILGPPEPGTGVREVLDYGPAAPPKED